MLWVTDYAFAFPRYWFLAVLLTADTETKMLEGLYCFPNSSTLKPLVDAQLD